MFFVEEEELFICHIHNNTEYNSSEMCSLYLTHSSAHTVVNTHTHTHTHTHLEQWASGEQSGVQCPAQLWTIPAGAEI